MGILLMHATLLILDIMGVFNNVNHGVGRCIWIRPYFEYENLDACHFPHSSGFNPLQTTLQRVSCEFMTFSRLDKLG